MCVYSKMMVGGEQDVQGKKDSFLAITVYCYCYYKLLFYFIIRFQLRVVQSQLIIHFMKLLREVSSHCVCVCVKSVCQITFFGIAGNLPFLEECLTNRVGNK